MTRDHTVIPENRAAQRSGLSGTPLHAPKRDSKSLVSLRCTRVWNDAGGMAGEAVSLLHRHPGESRDPLGAFKRHAAVGYSSMGPGFRRDDGRIEVSDPVTGDMKSEWEVKR